MPKATTADIQKKLQDAFNLQKKGIFPDAKKIYEDVLSLQPKNFNALYFSSVLHAQTGDLATAHQLILSALQVNPGSAEAHFNCGNILLHMAKPDEALACYDNAIAIKPDIPEAYYNKGNILIAKKEYLPAISCYEMAANLKPDFAEAHNNCGNAFMAIRQFEMAEQCYVKAIAGQGNMAEAHNNMGNALLAQHKPDAAIACYDRAITLRENYADAYCNKGSALVELQKPDAAIALYDQSIALKPGNVDAYWHKSLALLLSGSFQQGWDLYNWRWQSARFESVPLRTTRPKWTPENNNGRLLIWAEQGIGDEIMFGSFLRFAHTLSRQLVVQINPRLLPLFQRSLPNIPFLPSNIRIPEFNYATHMPMGDLPKYTWPQFTHNPTADKKFLYACKSRTEIISREIHREKPLLCGISWKSGNPNSGHKRSVPLGKLLSHLNNQNIQFISLQYGDVTDEIAEAKQQTGIDVQQYPGVDNMHDLDGLAALIASCDLVISVANATVHLAGALGKTTWALAPYVPEWRWQLDRTDTLWYSSVRLYRQQHAGEWEPVFCQLRNSLDNLLASFNSQSSQSSN